MKTFGYALGEISVYVLVLCITGIPFFQSTFLGVAGYFLALIVCAIVETFLRKDKKDELENE